MELIGIDVKNWLTQIRCSIFLHEKFGSKIVLSEGLTASPIFVIVL
jgi:hypothetical protein